MCYLSYYIVQCLDECRSSTAASTDYGGAAFNQDFHMSCEVFCMHAEDFDCHMKVLVENGASVVGGCCGTTPAFIKALHDAIR